jgi:hypothetical protein
MRAALLVLTTLALACRKPAPPEGPAPRLLVGVSTSTDMTVIGASLYPANALAYRDRACLGVRLRDGREPASLNGGRVEAFVVNGNVLGHADLTAAGVYQAAVRAVLPPGTLVSARIAGDTAVPALTFHTPAPVPQNVRVTAPARGFALTPGEGLTVRWEGGDSSDVMIVLQATRGANAQGDGWMLSCVVPRAPGSFTLPTAGLAAGLIPAGVDTVTVVATADARVREGDYAIDVTPVGRDEDLVTGTISSPAPTR